MIVREMDRYTLRQMFLPSEYREKLGKVKSIIRRITGKNVTIETAVMCLIDEFNNMHAENQEAETQDADKKDAAVINCDKKEVGNE